LGPVGMTRAGKETARTQGTPGLERWRGKEDDSANSPRPYVMYSALMST
jgi:hypothetical protein